MRHGVAIVALALVILGIGSSALAVGDETIASIEGVWKVVEIRQVGPKGEAVVSDPEPGLYIFTAKHYSMVWTPGSAERPGSATTWFPTNEEKVQDFNTIIVNSGTYEMADSTMTTYPVVAKTPEFVGGKAVYHWRVAADTLWLTMVDTYASDGTQDPWVLTYRTPVKLARLE